MIPQVAHAADSAAISGSGWVYCSSTINRTCYNGTGYAVGSVGSSALGAVSEDPKILGKTLIFVGLAEGIAIYGLNSFHNDIWEDYSRKKG